MIESFHNVSNPSVSKHLHGERDTSKCLNPLSPLLTNIRSNREIQPSLSWQDCHIPEAVFPNKCLDRCCWESQRKRRDECCPVLNPTHSPNTLCICTVHCFPGPWATEVKALYRLDLTGTRDTDTGLYSDRMLYTYHLSTYLFLPPARDFFFSPDYVHINSSVCLTFFLKSHKNLLLISTEVNNNATVDRQALENSSYASAWLRRLGLARMNRYNLKTLYAFQNFRK